MPWQKPHRRRREKLSLHSVGLFLEEFGEGMADMYPDGMLAKDVANASPARG
ncbi:MAG: hypothetical protein LLH30_12740 [Candidatus Manganitrophus sp. SA1]|nr:hypothetical protein [Candidatus Manganitrophus morganii]